MSTRGCSVGRVLLGAGVGVGDANVSLRERGAMSGLGLSLALPKDEMRDFTLESVRLMNVRDLCRFMMDLLSTNVMAEDAKPNYEPPPPQTQDNVPHYL